MDEIQRGEKDQSIPRTGERRLQWRTHPQPKAQLKATLEVNLENLEQKNQLTRFSQSIYS